LFNNILLNAIEFTPIGGRIHVTSKFDNDRVVIVSVKYNGIGISRENIAKELLPFGQLTSAQVF